MSHRISIGVKDKRLGSTEETIPLVVPGQHNLDALERGLSPSPEQIRRAIEYEVRRRKKMEAEKGGVANSLRALSKPSIEP